MLVQNQLGRNIDELSEKVKRIGRKELEKEITQALHGSIPYQFLIMTPKNIEVCDVKYD